MYKLSSYGFRNYRSDRKKVPYLHMIVWWYSVSKLNVDDHLLYFYTRIMIMNRFIKLVLFIRYIQNLNMTWVQIIFLGVTSILLVLELLMIFMNIIVDRKRAVRYLPIALMTLLIGMADIYAGQIAEMIANNIWKVKYKGEMKAYVSKYN